MAFDWEPYAPQPWRAEVVPFIAPILIQRAKAGRTISYSELAEELQRRHGLEPKARKTLYGQPVGAVGFALLALGKQWGETIPPLNALVVGKYSKMPGIGADYFILRFLRKKPRGELSRQDRRVLAEQVIKQVWNYPQASWDRVAEALDAELLEPGSLPIEDEEPINLPPVPRGYGGESDEHEALKLWVCEHPKFLATWGRFKRGKSEKVIPSGDRLDAFFESSRGQLAVEVKASHAPDAELTRGVFQCIKYREVLRAAQLAQGELPNAQAVLVTTRSLDQTTKRLCKRLQVQVLIAPMKAELGAT